MILLYRSSIKAGPSIGSLLRATVSRNTLNPGDTVMPIPDLVPGIMELARWIIASIPEQWQCLVCMGKKGQRIQLSLRGWGRFLNRDLKSVQGLVVDSLKEYFREKEQCKERFQGRRKQSILKTKSGAGENLQFTTTSLWTEGGQCWQCSWELF